MALSSTDSDGAAKDCLRLRLFLPLRFFFFFASEGPAADCES